VNAVVNLRLQKKNTEHFSTSWEPVSFIGRTLLHGFRMMSPLSTPWRHVRALDKAKWSNLRSGLLPPGKNIGTHWRGGWMDPIAGLDVMEERKISFPGGAQMPDLPAHSLITIPTTLQGWYMFLILADWFLDSTSSDFLAVGECTNCETSKCTGNY
jgi:hypothetical protein